jgi:hypothetical protein
MPKMLFLVLPMLMIVATPSLAQPVDSALIIPTEFGIRGGGWSQLGETSEVLEFLAGLLETVLMTAMLAFHPVNIASRRHSSDWMLSGALFLYALIGLVIGFLVVHHGVLVGFVVFGIGGLVRFRMETISLTDTAQLIFVALIGLSVGLDIPVMALLLTIAAAIVIFVFGRLMHETVEVRFTTDCDFGAALERLQNELKAAGLAISMVSKAKFKPNAELVVSSTDGNARTTLVSLMSNLTENPGNGIEDWHLE